MNQSYDVLTNIADSFQNIVKADYVIAFCDLEVFLVKSRSAKQKVDLVPCRPDKVIAYYCLPKPHFKELSLRPKE